ncbi:Lrp/AsnC family transcriptional regulator [Paraburkholderia megapolitana]|uniref:Lrp/AsnC family transcriptional regulator n=1 Tax=Paraburkholderia megapolitana TaxID=420953 RepID=UPI0014791A59
MNIRGCHSCVERLKLKKLGLGVLAFVRLSVADHSEPVLTKIETRLAAHQNVLSCHKVSGDTDYLVQIVAKDLDEYSRFFTSIFSDLPGIVTLHSNLSLQEVKATSQLPIY